ncbi:GntR family transcriptional regulator [Paenibacillus sp. GYB003]|uniref:GntR family transcriptional regulator n=1 Tax=Paenibacillus sp. GYB003 TaxID=2994392 RepID=UPI003FA6F57C
MPLPEKYRSKFHNPAIVRSPIVFRSAQIKEQIVNGKLTPGQKLPSTRELRDA